MAKITGRKLEEVKQRILHEGSCLEREAFDLQLPMEELRYLLQRRCNGGVKSSEYKAILRNSETTASRIPKEELSRLRIPPKPVKRKTSDSAPVPTECTPAEKLLETALPVEESSMDPMDELVLRKCKLEEELEFRNFSLEKAKEILSVRLETLKSAKSALQRAQAYAQTAEAEVEEARLDLRYAEDKLTETQVEANQVLTDIEDLKTNTIWLIDPWYSGPIPEYGILISNVELEGVTVQQVEEEYLPEPTLEGVMKFEHVPDYKRALEFCGLVTKFELEDKSYRLCVSDEKLKELLKVYIG